jgi:hypothetical protein
MRLFKSSYNSAPGGGLLRVSPESIDRSSAAIDFIAYALGSRTVIIEAFKQS